MFCAPWRVGGPNLRDKGTTNPGGGPLAVKSPQAPMVRALRKSGPPGSRGTLAHTPTASAWLQQAGTSGGCLGLGPLVHGEVRRVGSELEEHTAQLLEVDGQKYRRSRTSVTWRPRCAMRSCQARRWASSGGRQATCWTVPDGRLPRGGAVQATGRRRAPPHRPFRLRSESGGRPRRPDRSPGPRRAAPGCGGHPRPATARTGSRCGKPWMGIDVGEQAGAPAGAGVSRCPRAASRATGRKS